MAATPGYQAGLFLASAPSLTLTNEAMTDSGDHKTFNVTNTAHQAWDYTASFVVQAEWDEIQTVTITGGPTGGTFTLVFGGQTTAALNWNATAAQVQTALQALSSINANNALVTGGPGPGTAFTVEFTAALGYAPQALITLGTNSLTGGVSPGVSIARVQSGQTWTNQAASAYTIAYAAGQVIETTALLGTPALRISSGKYFPIAFVIGANSIEFTGTGTTLDVSQFHNPPVPWKDFIAGVNGATAKIGKWWIDGTFLADLNAGTILLLRIFPNQSLNNRYQGFGVLARDSIKAAVAAATSEELDFTVNGQLYYLTN